MKEAREIKKLNESVINRIAAGEVIQRPANALKELIENSLDANSTNIQITVKEGGLKMLQIQDNGCGIRKEDFNIVCERFTTSKLKEFEDLQSISTYGFRGEALASISHIAHLCITSRTSNDICAYKANYVDGKLKDRPKPTAGNSGTTITVEDLFFNMNVRRKSLRSPLEEYQKITEVVSKYSIHNATVGFSLRKFNDVIDIRTPINSNYIDNIRIIYGNSLARELVEFKLDNHLPKFTCNGHFTNVNYSVKKFTFLLFINNRLVDCPNLKRSIDQIFSTYLPKQKHPFVYLNLQLDPISIDVNVHPTKHEVHFLNEDQIIESICGNLEAKLLNISNSRVFYTQAKLPGFENVDILPVNDRKSNKQDQKSFVRTDASEQKLDKFFGTPMPKQTGNLMDIIRRQSIDSIEEQERRQKTDNSSKLEKTFTSFISKITRVETQLTSILELRKCVEDQCHRTLRDVFAQHVFVGSINPSQSLIQCNTKLYICNTRKIMQELFYQLILYNFQNFAYMRFSEALPIRELALRALDLEVVGWTPADGDKSHLAEKIAGLLVEKREMLNEYFSLEIDLNGNLISIPLLLENYQPDLSGLLVYIVCVATEVDWSNEKQCFHTFAKETANYYANLNESVKLNDNDWKWIVEHVFYSAIKEYFIPPKSFTENSAILEIADLPKLYKVFERC